MRKAFCGCRCLHSALLLLPVFPLPLSPALSTPSSSSFVLLPTVSLLLIRPVCSVPRSLCLLVYAPVSLSLPRCLSLVRCWHCTLHAKNIIISRERERGEGSRGEIDRERQSNCLPDRRRRHKPPKINNANGKRHR